MRGLSKHEKPRSRPERGAASAILLSVMVVTIVLGPAATTGATETIEADPEFFYLGSFSTLEPLESDIVPGQTVIRISSSVSLQLETQLEGPARRLSDGLELPLDRLQETHPSIPPEVANLQPYIYTTGEGSPEIVEIEGDWLDLASNLEVYFDLGDPPGTYEVTGLVRLLDSQGIPLTDYVSIVMQFDIEPWVHFAATPLPDCEIPVPEGVAQGQSEIVLVTVSSNTEWTLTVCGTGDLESENGSLVLPLSDLQICTEEFGTFGWRPRRSGCETVQLSPVALVTGAAPEPFTVAYEDVPIYVRFEGEAPLSAGRYGGALSFDVTTDGLEQ